MPPVPTLVSPRREIARYHGLRGGIQLMITGARRPNRGSSALFFRERTSAQVRIEAERVCASIRAAGVSRILLRSWGVADAKRTRFCSLLSRSGSPAL